MNLPFFLTILVLFFLSNSCLSHQASNTYLSIEDGTGSYNGVIDINLQDLHSVLNLDRDKDKSISWGEVINRHAEIDEYLHQRLTFSKGTSCKLQPDDLKIINHQDGVYANIPFLISCSQIDAPLEIHYNLLFDLDASHRGILRLGTETVQTVLFSPSNRTWKEDAHSDSFTLSSFLRSGIYHIWIGLDHILFILVILIPVVFKQSNNSNQTESSLVTVLKKSALIISIFTLAHSLSLSLAVFGYLSIPSPIVESIIALSIILSAANIIYPLWRNYTLLVTFIFGLFHGCGFASVLAEAFDLNGIDIAWPLIAFNLGVEIGQLAIVLLFVPTIYLLRNYSIYQKIIVPFGATAILLVACFWFCERVIQINFLLS